MALRQGSAGPKVRRVQDKLGITVDGIFGARTENAVRQFQRQHGLKVDGVVGPNTWHALFDSGFSGGGAFSLNGGLLDKVIGGILLYGIFKVLMKIF